MDYCKTNHLIEHCQGRPVFFSKEGGKNERQNGIQETRAFVVHKKVGQD
jgi:hypothetical protein